MRGYNQQVSGTTVSHLTAWAGTQLGGAGADLALVILEPAGDRGPAVPAPHCYQTRNSHPSRIYQQADQSPTVRPGDRLLNPASLRPKSAWRLLPDIPTIRALKSMTALAWLCALWNMFGTIPPSVMDRSTTLPDPPPNPLRLGMDRSSCRGAGWADVTGQRPSTSK